MAAGPINLKATLSGLCALLEWEIYTQYDLNGIDQKEEGGSWAWLHTVNGWEVSYLTPELTRGKTYYWRVIGINEGPPPEYSDYSNEASLTIPLATPTGLSLEVLSKSSIKLTWTDNATGEDGYDVYRDGVKIDDIAANSVQYTDTGLDPGTEYHYKVKCHLGTAFSAFSNEAAATTLNVPAAPSGPTATASSSTQINLNWVDNASDETGYSIEESSNGTDFAEHTTVGAGITSYSRTGLSAGQERWYRVRAYNAEGYSGYSNVASAMTLTNIGKPTNVQVFSVQGTVVDVTFQDNSTAEDGHSVEYKIGAGSFSEFDEIEPNRTFCRINSGIAAGNLVTVRVRARQGAAYSSYSDEAAVTTPVTPSTPTGLAISDHRDTWQELAWNAVGAAAGYVIYLSTNGSSFPEYLRVQRPDVLSVKVYGRTPNTQYWYKISAYNGTGESALSAAVDGTTDVEYEEDKAEKYLRRTAAKVVVLAEINPRMEVTGFSLTSGETYCYEIVIAERGVEITEVFENGTAYTEEDSQADVETYPSTWYFDSATRKLYVHTSGGNAPSNYQIDAGFWLCFTNWRDETHPMVFGGNNYLPFLTRSRVPDISQQVHPFFEHSLSVSSGTIGLNNVKMGTTYFFDKLWRRYKWENRKVVLKAGGPDFAYADYKTVYTGVVKSKKISDECFELGLTDLRESAWRDVPISEFWATEYVNLDENASGRKKPFSYGSVVGAIAVCVDTVNKKHMFHDGRIHAVSNVYVNDVAVTIGTNCFIDYQRGVVEFAEAYTIETTDVVTVDFEGIPETYGTEPIEDAGEVFLDFLIRFLGMTVDDVDTDSVYYVKKVSATTLCVPLDGVTSSNEVIKSIEQSVFAFSRQDGEGRIGLVLAETTAPSWAKRIRDYQIVGPELTNDPASLYKSVKVHYLENKVTKAWSVVTRTKPSIDFSYGVTDDLKVYTYSVSEADATEVADAFLPLFDKDPLEIRVKGLGLLGALAGDVVYVSRDRYYNADGTLSEKKMRIMKVAYRFSSNETQLTLQEVA